jgi:hypothetical protein
MNIYVMIGHNVGSPDAVELGERLSAWHDSMVAHERRPAGGADCDDECPHVEAGALWKEAVATFGPYAADLKFLRSRGMIGARPAVRGRTATARVG